MFKRLRKVDIEIHNKCNRNCDWCSNKVMDEEPLKVFPEELYRKTLNDLVDNGFGQLNSTKYSSVFTFARYNEPLMYPDILISRIEIATEILPYNVRLEMNTNGDFLTKELLDKLKVDGLNIMDYDNKGMDYWLDRFEDMGVYITELKENIIIGMSRSIKKVKCSVNWKTSCKIENRGGLVDIDNLDNPKVLEGATRNVPCIDPLYTISIEADGTYMPCYNMRSGSKKHKDYIVGNVKDTPIHELYLSDKIKEIRREIINGDSDKFPNQCKRCNRIRPGYYEGIYYVKSWYNVEDFKKRVIYLKEGEYIDE